MNPQPSIRIIGDSKTNDQRSEEGVMQHSDAAEAPAENNSPQRINNGVLVLDATVADQDIKYPTDLGLLNEAREKLEAIIASICRSTAQRLPRMYRRLARRDYLALAKNKKPRAG